MMDKYDLWFAQRHERKLRRQLKARAMATCITHGIAMRFWIWTTIRQPTIITTEMC